MQRQSFWLAVMVACIAVGSEADTIQLRDNASITGKILADRRDQVVVDVGYTVLVIPREQIIKVGKGDQVNAPTEAATKAVASPTADAGEKISSKDGFYQSYSKPGKVQNVRDLVAVIGEAVVQVRTPGGLGSGFILNEDGFLITNVHVIEGETQITVEVYERKDGQLTPKSYKDVRIVALNKFADMALLKIEDKGASKFKSVALGSSDLLAVGERVFAIGSPLGLERTVTEGILSTKSRQMQGGLYLQTTTQINPGNSGGPLFNMSGEVVGITNMKASYGEGLGFAIPSEMVRYFLDHRDGYAYSNDNPSNPFHYLPPPGKNLSAAAQ
jgi:serine protease Do